MSELEPAIRINMDPTNPGQFFACCGLLELADRLCKGGAEGWFRGQDFCIACEETAQELLRQLAQCEIKSSLSDQQVKRLGTLLSANKSKLTRADVEEKEQLRELWERERLHFCKPFDLWLDWWWDDRTGGKRLKTWAAKQFVLMITRAMQMPLRAAAWIESPTDGCLARSVTADALPFYFDSGLSGQGSALDAGFSFDALGFKMPFRPLLELAAFVGLQRFRPTQVSGDRLFLFSLWSTPLPPSVAAAAACGALGPNGTRQYEFRLLNRSQYMKAFLPAQPYRGDLR